MSATVVNPIHYPESDGKPLADNTKQLRWILTLAMALMGMFRRAADVFVGSDLLWYPVEGEPGTVVAPDVFVVFGRPKGDRGSYKQWKEGGVPMTVVFEIWSPANDIWEYAAKLAFYDEHGVEEYYVYDPDRNTLSAYRRGMAALVLQKFKDGVFVSPRLGIRFDTTGPELVVYGPDGKRFPNPEEAAEERDQADKRAESESKRADQLAALTRKLLDGQATPEEIQELRSLSSPTA